MIVVVVLLNIFGAATLAAAEKHGAAASAPAFASLPLFRGTAVDEDGFVEVDVDEDAGIQCSETFKRKPTFEPNFQKCMQRFKAVTSDKQKQYLRNAIAAWNAKAPADKKVKL